MAENMSLRTDCFEAMRDYLAEQNISILPRILFEDNWFEKGLDYFASRNCKRLGRRRNFY